MSLNDGFEYREQLGPDADGETLEAYLSQRYPHSSPEEWRERVEAGRVRLDSAPARPGDIIRRGRTLTWRRPPWNEPDAPRTFAVLHDDGTLLAVAKPAGLPTLPGGGFHRSTLLHLVRDHASDAVPVHRLGRWTSGVVLFARGRAVRGELSRQWAARSVRKRYRALATGHPAKRAWTVAAPIGPVPHPLLGTVHAASPSGKPAITHVAVLERRGDGFLCEMRIETGRPHQVRIHLAAAGHPLVGDPLYGIGGVPLPDSRALPGDPGYHLHAAELSFRHPISRRVVTIECAPPPVLRRQGA